MLKLLLIVLCVILCLLACSHEPEESAETASPPVTETVETEPSATPPIIPEPEEIAKTQEIMEPEFQEVAEPSCVDWIDFVKFNGQTYCGDWSVTTVPYENIGELLGYIENEVPSMIENFSEYVVPDNASPFRSIGTPFYTVLDNENAIAVYEKNKDTYYLYQLKE